MAGRTGAAARGRPSRGAARRWCRSDFRVNISWFCVCGSIEDLLHYITLYYINTCNIWKKMPVTKWCEVEDSDWNLVDEGIVSQ